MSSYLILSGKENFTPQKPVFWTIYEDFPEKFKEYPDKLLFSNTGIKKSKNSRLKTLELITPDKNRKIMLRAELGHLYSHSRAIKSEI